MKEDKKLIKLILFLAVLIAASNIVSAQHAPVLYFSDLTSGPNTGGQNNKGAFVTIFGKNFGSSKGSSYVTIGGGQADNYLIWSDTKISFQLGQNAQTGSIIVHTSEGESNGLPFTIRNCDIYFVSTSGNDNNDGFFNNPWRHLSKARDIMNGGDILYIRGGTYTSAGEDSSGELFYVSGSYPWGGAASDGNPHCIVGYPGETVIFQATANGQSIINYVGGNDQVAMSSNIVFANFIIDADNHQSSIGWRGVRNGASHIYRVKNIRFVNLEVKNYLLGEGGSGGGASIIGAGADGPVDNVKILGCNLHHMDTWDSLDHLIYMDAGGDNHEIGWNMVHDLFSSASDHYPGYGIQLYAGGDANYDDFTNAIVHDNIIYDCNGRGGINFADRVISANVYNNIVYGCEGHSLYGGYAARMQSQVPGTIYFYNNLLSSERPGSYLDALLDVSFAGNTYYISNNIFYTTNSKTYSESANWNPTISSSNNLWYGNGVPPTWASGELNTNPLFINPTSDFHLQASSPAIDAGSNSVSSVVKTDYEGISRPQGNGFDIGAYEYASSLPMHPADTNQNNIIEMKEMIAFIARWKNAEVTVNDVMSVLDRWMKGS